jgi:16S rRNA (cytidine1402-2'-O)-methyltransferase
MTLVVCATPIGNLEDVTLRVLAELRAADLVLCEDTRHTRGLLTRHGISDVKLLSYHEHNEAARTDELLPRLVAGERIALVSDAGMPGVSDPGARIVRAALEAEVLVTVLPGPSAVETALVASGFAGEAFQFVGFLPRKANELAALWATLTMTTVAFESPQRLPATLASLASFDAARPVAVCRELTKKFEEVVRGRAAEVSARFAHPPKGEITLVIGAGEREPDEAAALQAVAELVAAGVARKRAAEIVSSLTDVPRNTLYRRSL